MLLACTTGDVRSSAQDRVAAVMAGLHGVAANNCVGMERTKVQDNQFARQQN